MTGHARFALIQGQELFFGIEGLVVHGDSREHPAGQACDQGLAIGAATKGGLQPPAFRHRIEGPGVGHQMPPAHRGQGP